MGTLAETEKPATAWREANYNRDVIYRRDYSSSRDARNSREFDISRDASTVIEDTKNSRDSSVTAIRRQ